MTSFQRIPQMLRASTRTQQYLGAYRMRWTSLQPVVVARSQSNAPQTPQTPESNEQPASAAKQSMQEYRNLRRPWLRVFLLAFFTYQISYWSWEKMRTDEIVAEKEGEVQALEQEVEVYQKTKEAKAAAT